MATSKQGNKQGGTSNRGFASMDPQRQREIASEGGKAAHEKGTAHEFTSEEARRAGSLSHGNRQSASAGAHSSQNDEGRTAGRAAGSRQGGAGKDSKSGKTHKGSAGGEGDKGGSLDR